MKITVTGNTSDKVAIKRELPLGTYIKGIEIVKYNAECRVFVVETTENWGERHPNFY